MFCKLVLPLGMPCSPLIPLDPSPAHMGWELHGQLPTQRLFPAWSLASHVICFSPLPTAEQKRARILQEFSRTFLLAFIKHFAIIKKKGIEKSELLSLPLTSQFLQSSAAVGTITCTWCLAGTGRGRAQPGFQPGSGLVWLSCFCRATLLWALAWGAEQCRIPHFPSYFPRFLPFSSSSNFDT